MELVFQLLVLLGGIVFIFAMFSILAFKMEMQEEWIKKFKEGQNVISTKYGEGIIICVKPSRYKAYIEFENFTGWFSLNDIIPVGKYKKM